MRRKVGYELAQGAVLLGAATPAAILVAAALLSEGRLRIALLVAAGFAFVVTIFTQPPTTLWLEGGVLHARQLRRMRICPLTDVVEVRLEFIRWTGDVLFLQRTDGTGFIISNLATRTASVRGAVGDELVRLGKKPIVMPEARGFLGI